MSAKYDPHQIKDAIQRQCYFDLALNIKQEHINQVIKDFFAFINLPDEEKAKFAIDIKQDERDRGTDLGWRRRSVDSGFGYDNKEFFHYNDDAKELFKASAAQAPIVQALLTSIDPIYQTVYREMEEIVRALNEIYPGLYPKLYDRQGTGVGIVMRILKYDRTRSGDFLAKGHYDRGSCTIAIAESAPGLRVGPDDQRLTEVIHHPGRGLFFPGISMGQYTNNELLPTWHDVLQQGDIAYSDDASRWAIVFFCSPPDPNYFDRTTVHTPVRRADNGM